MSRALIVTLLLALIAAPVRGEDAAALYATHCASCHGARLEGQPNWFKANAAGRLPAPPLDVTGHAWQHSDAELTDLLLDGMAVVAGPDYATDMPTFGATLSPAEIAALVGFMKRNWPVGTRALQASLNPDGASAIADLLKAGGEWTFPPDCMTPGQRAAARAWKAAKAAKPQAP
jgi:mono/diheme cytochrome c family protein